MAVVAQLESFSSSEQNVDGARALPARLGTAQARRPKLMELLAGGTQARATTVNKMPTQVLAQAARAINAATFTGKGDRVVVLRLLAELEWLIKGGVEQAFEQQWRAEFEVQPSSAETMEKHSCCPGLHALLLSWILPRQQVAPGGIHVEESNLYGAAVAAEDAGVTARTHGMAQEGPEVELIRISASGRS